MSNAYEDALERAKLSRARCVVGWIAAYFLASMPLFLTFPKWAVPFILVFAVTKGVESFARAIRTKQLFETAELERLIAQNKSTAAELERKLELIKHAIDEPMAMIKDAEQEMSQGSERQDYDLVTVGLLRYFVGIIWADYRLCLCRDQKPILLDELNNAGNGKAYLNILKEHFRQHCSTIDLVFPAPVERYIVNMDIDVFKEFRKVAQNKVIEFATQ